MNQLASSVSEQLVGLLGLVVVILIGRVTEALRKKFHSDTAKNVLNRVDGLVFDVVNEMEQTMVAQLREMNADGKLTPDEIKIVGSTALSNLKSHLGPKGLADMKSLLGLDENSVDALIKTKLESQVAQIRAAGASGAALLKTNE